MSKSSIVALAASIKKAVEVGQPITIPALKGTEFRYFIECLG